MKKIDSKSWVECPSYPIFAQNNPKEFWSSFEKLNCSFLIICINSIPEKIIFSDRNDLNSSIALTLFLIKRCSCSIICRVLASIAIWSLRHWWRYSGWCFLRFHSPSPKKFKPVESTMSSVLRKEVHHDFFDSELQYQYAFVFYTAWNNLVLSNLIHRV